MIKAVFGWCLVVGVVAAIATGVIGVTGFARHGVAVFGGAIACGITYWRLQARRTAKAGGDR